MKMCKPNTRNHVDANTADSRTKVSANSARLSALDATIRIRLSHDKRR